MSGSIEKASGSRGTFEKKKITWFSDVRTHARPASLQNLREYTWNKKCLRRFVWILEFVGQGYRYLVMRRQCLKAARSRAFRLLLVTRRQNLKARRTRTALRGRSSVLATASATVCGCG